MFVVSALLLLPCVAGYTQLTRFSLRMGGGRSMAEKSMTNKQMFRSLRDKFNEAAKTPGFFESAGSHVVCSAA